MRVAIYNYQFIEEGCPACSQTYQRALIMDTAACKNKIEQIYGEGCEFFNYTDRGQYELDNLARPEFQRMMRNVEEGKLDVIIVSNLAKISTEVSLILDTYQKCKSYGVLLITHRDGLEAEKMLEKAWKELRG